MSEIGDRARVDSRSAAKRRQIVAAARRLFLDRGFERTSMEAIREAAGVSKPTLYAYYLSKEDLFAAVVREFVDGLAAAWLPATTGQFHLGSQADLHRALAALAHQAISVLLEPESVALVRVVIAETPAIPRLGAIFREAVPERGLAMVAALLGRARDQGLIGAPDLEAAARLFIGPLLTYQYLDGLLSAGPPRRPSPRQIDALVDLYLNAIA